jgi:patatin-like phospholipase/acyl hydrolase
MKKYRILSFDGGGLKGLISIGILERLSAELGGDGWLEMADMYAGTSTGGLISLALASGKSLADIKEFYQKAGPEIFNRKTLLYISSCWKFLHVGYDNQVLKSSLFSMFENRRLDQLSKKVLIVSFDLSERIGKRKSWAPKIFQNFESKGRDKDLVRQVGLYTSAAPTFLPAVDGFIDGGVCANNPSMCSLSQILDQRLKDRRDLKEVHLISIGAGVNPESIQKRSIRWGVLGWNLKLLRIIMDGSVGIADYQCRQILTEKRYLRLQKDLDEKIEMDDASKIQEMSDEGQNIDREVLSDWVKWIKLNWLN